MLTLLFADDNVQLDPANGTKVYSTSTWEDLYREKYCPLAKLVGKAPVTKEVFLSLRSYHRKNYKKSKRIKNKGWMHLSCQLCDNFLDDIRKEANEVRKSEIRAELLRHRDHYVCILHLINLYVNNELIVAYL